MEGVLCALATYARAGMYRFCVCVLCVAAQVAGVNVDVVRV